jgi:hypothetical protein
MHFFVCSRHTTGFWWQKKIKEPYFFFLRFVQICFKKNGRIFFSWELIKCFFGLYCSQNRVIN